MSAWEIILLVVIMGLAVFGLVWSIRRNKKKGGCCGEKCSGCPACPSDDKKTEDKK